MTILLLGSTQRTRVLPTRACPALVRPTSCRRGITIIELLVVLAIVGILMALLIPAVQMAREAARGLQCRNHLKQLGLAFQSHHQEHKHFPSGGWGYRWVGDPDQGHSVRQPGGWVYSVLPYVEQNALRRLGARSSASAKRAATLSVLQSPLAVMHCPSRRSAQLYPFTQTRVPLFNCDPPEAAAKGDYAVNGGHLEIGGGPGPAGLDASGYRWPDMRRATGISFVRSRIRVADITGGTSHTIVVGEKYLNHDQYDAGHGAGDDQTLYLGDDADVRRFTSVPPVPDRAGIEAVDHFGSPHPGGCHFVLADGAVSTVTFDVDRAVFQALGSRLAGPP